MRMLVMAMYANFITVSKVVYGNTQLPKPARLEHGMFQNRWVQDGIDVAKDSLMWKAGRRASALRNPQLETPFCCPKHKNGGA